MTGNRPSLRRMALGAALAVLLPAFAAAAPNRLAVVVGNQDYDRITNLGNARADAERMAEMLAGFGFSIFEGYDLDRRGFEELLRASILNADDGAEIVFFYAGHGIQIGRRNYLLPTDVAFDSIYDLPVQSVTLDRVIDLLSARGQVHVAIIDACRDNPFPDKLLAGKLDASLFETKSGFDVFQTPLNSLVAFSTSPGMLAFDGEEQGNSPYTRAILDTVQNSPEADVLAVFSQVRASVHSVTGGKQVPWESSTLVQPFRFLDERFSDDHIVVAQAETAQQGESATDAPGRGGAALADLPATITLEVEYDREVPLTADLTAALGADGPLDISLTDAPEDGRIDALEGGLIYRPRITERRSDRRELALADQFSIAVETADGPVPVAVTLDMEVNGCDLGAGDALDPGGVGFYRLPNEIEVAPALADCRDAVARNPDTARFRYQLGRAEQAAGLLEEAFGSFNAAAEAGHVRALNAAARLMMTDKIDRDVIDIPPDLDRALSLLDRGIAAGDPFAIHSMGLRLLREGETREAQERGFDLLDQAAELGHTYSMNELGIYFLTKDSEHYIPERGMRYLEASEARDDIYGFHNLGFVALYGLEAGEVDLSEAYRQFRKAALGGHPNSPATLGRMIIRGQVPGEGPDAALEWYDMGLSRGDGWGGANGAALILNGAVSGHDTADALVRAAKAMHLSDGQAAETARGLLEGRSERDLGRAVQMMLRDLGAQVTVDGVVGPSTRAALARLSEDAGLPAPPDNEIAQLEAAARIYWAQRPTRPDLF